MVRGLGATNIARTFGVDQHIAMPERRFNDAVRCGRRTAAQRKEPTMKVWKVLLVCVLGAAMVGPGWASGAEVMKDGVLWVENGAEPAQGRRDVQMNEIWRVGGEDGEDFFGLITDAVFGDEGNLYLLDTRLAEVVVYDMTGERLGTLSREGDGPGEVRFPAKILFMPDGSLGIAQIFPGRIVMVDKDDTPRGNWEVNKEKTEGGFFTMYDAFLQGKNIVVMGQETTQPDQTHRNQTQFAAAFDMKGNELVRYESHLTKMDFGKFEWIEDERGSFEFRHTLVGPDGRVYVASARNQYRINVYKPDGTPDRVITRTYEHQPREQKEIDRIEARLETQLARLPGAKWEVSKTEPDITALRVGPDGNLWVECSRGGVDQPEGVLFTWDVFDADGHFIKQVAARCPGDGTEDVVLWRGDYAVQVTGFYEAVRSLQGGGGAGAEDDEGEAEPMEVICYKVTRD